MLHYSDCGTVTVGSQPSNANAVSVYSATPQVVGATATYTCDANYYLDGTDFITCGATAVWSAFLFTCERK
jgi:hypothetical protein